MLVWDIENIPNLAGLGAANGHDARLAPANSKGAGRPRCDLFFEIGANVLPSGGGHHLTILISAERIQ